MRRSSTTRPTTTGCSGSRPSSGSIRSCRARTRPTQTVGGRREHAVRPRRARRADAEPRQRVHARRGPASGASRRRPAPAATVQLAHRAQDRRPRDQPAVRARRARPRAATRGDGRVGEDVTGQRRARARHPAATGRRRASRPRGGARRGVHPGRRVRAAQRAAGDDARSRGRADPCARRILRRGNVRGIDRGAALPVVREPAQRGQRRPATAAGQERRPRARGGQARLDRLRAVRARRSGRGRTPPVVLAERDLRAAGRVGAAHEPVLPDDRHDRRRPRLRRRTTASTATTSSTRSTASSSRSTSSRCTTSSARRAARRAGRSRTSTRPSRSTPSCSTSPSSVGRTGRATPYAVMEPGAGRGAASVRQATLHNQDVVQRQGRADRRHRRAAQGRRRHPRGARPGRRAARRHRARVRHARRAAPSAATPLAPGEGGRHRPALPQRAVVPGAGARPRRAHRLARRRSTSRRSGEVTAAALTQPLEPAAAAARHRGGAVRPDPRRPAADRGRSCATPRRASVKLDEKTANRCAARPSGATRPPRRRRPGSPGSSPSVRGAHPPRSAREGEDEGARGGFLVALNIRHVGPGRRARALAAVVRVDRRRSARRPRDELAAVEGRRRIIADSPYSTGSRWTGTARSWSGGRPPAHSWRRQDTPVPGRPPCPADVLEGLTVVATGSLEGYTPRGRPGRRSSRAGARRHPACPRRPISSRPAPGAGSKLAQGGGARRAASSMRRSSGSSSSRVDRPRSGAGARSGLEPSEECAKGEEHVLPPSSARTGRQLSQMVPTWVNASWRPVPSRTCRPASTDR